MGNTIRPVGNSYNSNNRYNSSTGAQPQGPYVRNLLEQKLAALNRQVENIRNNKGTDDLSSKAYLSMKNDQKSQIERLLLYMEAQGMQQS